MIEQIKKRVSKLLEQDKSGHGMDHINRVLALSLKFAKQEHGNKEIVSLIALLHDVDDYKLFGIDDSKKLTNAKKIMDDCNIDKDIQEQVCLEISNIGYNKRLKGRCPKTIEGKIVADADMCDTLGVTGFLRVYICGLEQNRPFFAKDIFPIENITDEDYIKNGSATSICHMFEKILNLKDMMLTKSGQAEAEDRHQIIVDILYHYFVEENVPQWIEYLDRYLQKKKEVKK